MWVPMNLIENQSILDGLRYVKNNLKVCGSHPMQCAEVYDKRGRHVGYYGYSHRGGQTFKKGDRLFNQRYKPKKSDYTAAEWKRYEQKHRAAIKRDIKSGWYKNETEAKRHSSISDVIPFRKRGKKIIKTMAEAKQAAINISNYLS